MNLRKLFKALFSPKPKPLPPQPADARVEADPYLKELFARLGDRYQLGADGAQILRRTGRARFNPMPVWIKAGTVRCEYEIRAANEQELVRGKALLDDRYGARLAALGLSQDNERTEEWGGAVLVRAYQGPAQPAADAAAAVRFVCEESETQLNLAAE